MDETTFKWWVSHSGTLEEERNYWKKITLGLISSCNSVDETVKTFLSVENLTDEHKELIEKAWPLHIREMLDGLNQELGISTSFK